MRNLCHVFMSNIPLCVCVSVFFVSCETFTETLLRHDNQHWFRRWSPDGAAVFVDVGSEVSV